MEVWYGRQDPIFGRMGMLFLRYSSEWGFADLACNKKIQVSLSHGPTLQTILIIGMDMLG
jgi:hypothetical protein